MKMGESILTDLGTASSTIKDIKRRLREDFAIELESTQSASIEATDEVVELVLGAAMLEKKKVEEEDNASMIDGYANFKRNFVFVMYFYISILFSKSIFGSKSAKKYSVNPLRNRFFLHYLF